jgi:predicted tellurium resistance membrane protein TerC
MDWIRDPNVWLGFLSLTALEVVLGIDNIVFISILAGKLPPEQRAIARRLGLAVALITRILLLLSITWVMSLTAPLFTTFGQNVSGRDLILIVGGLFLLWKSVTEIHSRLEGAEHTQPGAKAATMAQVVAQIAVLDIVFSLDSVITAVGMSDLLGVMVAAVIAAVAVMLAFAGPISSFVDRHPTVKMLALAFLVLIGVNLVAEGFHQSIPKGYTYFAMAFALGVELLNLRYRARVEAKGSQLPASHLPSDLNAPSTGEEP